MVSTPLPYWISKKITQKLPLKSNIHQTFDAEGKIKPVVSKLVRSKITNI